MKFGEDLYGWGVFNIPMERRARSGGSLGSPQKHAAEPVRKLVKDVSWRTLGASALLTVLCLVGLLFFDRNAPKLPAYSEPHPVEVAVRILEGIPPAPPPAIAEIPVAPPEESSEAVIREAPPPLPEEIRPERKIPPPEPRKMVHTPPKPPEPVPVQSPPAEVPLPPPSSLQSARSEPPQVRTALPRQKAQATAQQQEVEPVLPKPSISTYEKRTETVSTALPERSAALRNPEAPLDLGEGPQKVRVAERGTAQATLPGASGINLARAEQGDPGASPGVSARYENLSGPPAAASGLPQKSDPTAVAEADIRLPKATAFAAPGVRREVAMLPPATRATSFGRQTDPDLTGAAVQTASLPAHRQAPEAPGQSYDFLDLLGPEELDRSVMVSLNRLRTCLDPNEELTLKTRLAAMLSHPGQCRSGGVIFDIRHPESAYSIHIDLYNYEQREFQDRCSALRLAVYSCEARR